MRAIVRLARMFVCTLAFFMLVGIRVTCLAQANADASGDVSISTANWSYEWSFIDVGGDGDDESLIDEYAYVHVLAGHPPVTKTGWSYWQVDFTPPPFYLPQTQLDFTVTAYSHATVTWFWEAAEGEAFFTNADESICVSHSLAPFGDSKHTGGDHDATFTGPNTPFSIGLGLYVHASLTGD